MNFRTHVLKNLNVMLTVLQYIGFSCVLYINNYMLFKPSSDTWRQYLRMRYNTSINKSMNVPRLLHSSLFPTKRSYASHLSYLPAHFTLLCFITCGRLKSSNFGSQVRIPLRTFMFFLGLSMLRFPMQVQALRPSYHPSNEYTGRRKLDQETKNGGHSPHRAVEPVTTMMMMMKYDEDYKLYPHEDNIAYFKQLKSEGCHFHLVPGAGVPNSVCVCKT